MVCRTEVHHTSLFEVSDFETIEPYYVFLVLFRYIYKSSLYLFYLVGGTFRSGYIKTKVFAFQE